MRHPFHCSATPSIVLLCSDAKKKKKNCVAHMKRSPMLCSSCCAFVSFPPPLLHSYHTWGSGIYIATFTQTFSPAPSQLSVVPQGFTIAHPLERCLYPRDSSRGLLPLGLAHKEDSFIFCLLVPWELTPPKQLRLVSHALRLGRVLLILLLKYV